jgi:hypothetical protein
LKDEKEFSVRGFSPSNDIHKDDKFQRDWKLETHAAY